MSVVPAVVRRRAGVLLLLVATVLVALPQPTARAAVREGVGLRGTVLGRTSWYGSYDVAGIGLAFCLDAERLAPDSDYDYRLGPPITGVLGAQIAYVAGTFGATRDPVRAAAVKLVLHDLQGARYPRGALDVMRLRASDLAGFAGRAADVVSAARTIMRAALTEYRIGPYRLDVRAPASVAPGATFAVDVTLADARGSRISGAVIRGQVSGASPRTVAGRTDSAGRFRFALRPDSPATRVRVSVTATAPSPVPVIYQPTRPGYVNRAQRVVVAGTVPTNVTVTADVLKPPPVTATVTVTKVGDATAYVGIDGAMFELHADSATGRRVAGPGRVTNGTVTFPNVETTGVASLWLVEVSPPEGYDVAEPRRLNGLSGRLTVEVTDRVRRGTLSLVKLDELNNEPVAGAVFTVRYDADHDGRFETDLGRRTSRTDPVTLVDLMPGDYEVVEVTPPPGYALARQGRTVVRVGPGGTASAVFTNSPLTTALFAKRPTGVYAAGASLAGAVFVVRDVDGSDVGRCVTDRAGRCGLREGSLLAGGRYCWKETAAPRGFARATGRCFTAARRSVVKPIVVMERGEYAVVRVVKRDATTKRPLAGATFTLWQDGAARPLARVRSAADGVAEFAPVLPGGRYCVAEVEAPPGYRRDPRRHCAVARRSGLLTFTVLNARVPVAARPMLPRTGTSTTDVARLGAAALLAGIGLLLIGASRPRMAYDWPDPGWD